MGRNSGAGGTEPRPAAGGGAERARAEREIPELERKRGEAPGDAELRARLGRAYLLVGRSAEARSEFEELVKLPKPPAAAWAALGALAEEREDWAEAESAYRRYAEAGGEAARRDIAGRLTLVRRHLLVAQARRALAREAELASGPINLRLVAVMPFRVEGPEQYGPLGRGLAEMLTTDLGLTGRIRVLERLRLQSLLDEMKLGMAGYTEPATGARSGQMLGAGRIVQGSLLVSADERMRLGTVVVEATRPGHYPAERRTSGTMAALLALELEVAIRLHRELGVELTPAEIARLRQRPSTNLQAFLAFSDGLEAMDRGDYARAASRFRDAARADPNFKQATEAAENADNAAVAETVSPQQVAQSAAASASGAAPATAVATRSGSAGGGGGASASGTAAEGGAAPQTGGGPLASGAPQGAALQAAGPGPTAVAPAPGNAPRPGAPPTSALRASSTPQTAAALQAGPAETGPGRAAAGPAAAPSNTAAGNPQSSAGTGPGRANPGTGTAQANAGAGAPQTSAAAGAPRTNAGTGNPPANAGTGTVQAGAAAAPPRTNAGAGAPQAAAAASGTSAAAAGGAESEESGGKAGTAAAGAPAAAAAGAPPAGAGGGSPPATRSPLQASMAATMRALVQATVPAGATAATTAAASATSAGAVSSTTAAGTTASTTRNPTTAVAGEGVQVRRRRLPIVVVRPVPAVVAKRP